MIDILPWRTMGLWYKVFTDERAFLAFFLNSMLYLKCYCHSPLLVPYYCAILFADTYYIALHNKLKNYFFKMLQILKKVSKEAVAV